MYGEHWSDDDLIARLYGVRSDDLHIRNCDACAARWEAVCRRREQLHQENIEVSEAFLAYERRAVEARMNVKRSRLRIALVPVMAALLVCVVIVAKRPEPAPLPQAEQISDSQLFEDVFSRVSAGEPTAVGPIHSLFEDQK